MSIYKTMDQVKAFFDKTPHWLSIKIHELYIWMVSNLGRTCPFALSLMNITMAESNSTYSSKMNVPKNCNKSEECLQIFNPTGAPILPSVPTVVWQGSWEWNVHSNWQIQRRFLYRNKNITATIQWRGVGASMVKWTKKVLRYILKLYCSLKVTLSNYVYIYFLWTKCIVS
jgi:hypothetical protein